MRCCHSSEDGVIDPPARKAKTRHDVFGLNVRKFLQNLLAGQAVASRSRTSVTRMRMPRTQGRPPHCAGSTVMRSATIVMVGESSQKIARRTHAGAAADHDGEFTEPSSIGKILRVQTATLPAWPSTLGLESDDIRACVRDRGWQVLTTWLVFRVPAAGG